jgi:hypothetical protein
MDPFTSTILIHFTCSGHTATTPVMSELCQIKRTLVVTLLQLRSMVTRPTSMHSRISLANVFRVAHAPVKTTLDRCMQMALMSVAPHPRLMSSRHKCTGAAVRFHSPLNSPSVNVIAHLSLSDACFF